jgi:hypothetical protein
MTEVLLAPHSLLHAREDTSRVFVSLVSEGAADEDGQVAVYMDQNRIGSLRESDGQRYQPALQEVRRRNAALIVQGILSRPSDKQITLRIYPVGLP